MSKPHVLVVGASVAGPMTAYWLARAGFRITVIERFPKLRPGGQNIDIRTSGVTIMRKIPGMEPSVRAKTTPQDALQFVNAKGKPYATVKPTGDPSQQGLLSEYEIFRDDLSGILFDLTKDNPNVRYVFGEQVSAIHQEEKGKVTVEFQEGKLPKGEYDLVVACDGATSRTRALGLHSTVRTHMHPINMWAAYSSVSTDYLSGGRACTMYTAVGGRAMGIGPDPAGGNRVCALAVLPRNEADATQAFRTAQKEGDAALRTYVRRHFAGCGWETAGVVDAMTAAPDFYASELVQIKLPALSRGRFTLVGDAGYAAGPTGGGTTLAMTGGYVLAGELLRHAGDIDAGLRAYEETMRPVIEDMQKIPPGIPTAIAPQTWWGIAIRDAVLVALTWGNAAFGWVLKYLAPSFGGDNYNLPEYEWLE
ncbi:FAD/NAD(P)-binding domain-containing protein [Karstenula rhodostoma CBS 690.94]|uniref:FAD/NAD(P)-binding domain-containing protein n=1 Tax=Karstenula rhodostoma CBS 690.94 TaxID=1392251 RepID=A0A9P4P6K1_9PLEO|nr:FAD/NAD(P)-binding domain-containing protein [Karstenula rhodostoma CBS 690.94]